MIHLMCSSFTFRSNDEGKEVLTLHFLSPSRSFFLFLTLSLFPLSLSHLGCSLLHSINSQNLWISSLVNQQNYWRHCEDGKNSLHYFFTSQSLQCCENVLLGCISHSRHADEVFPCSGNSSTLLQPLLFLFITYFLHIASLLLHFIQGFPSNGIHRFQENLIFSTSLVRKLNLSNQRRNLFTHQLFLLLLFCIHTGSNEC